MMTDSAAEARRPARPPRSRTGPRPCRWLGDGAWPERLRAARRAVLQAYHSPASSVTPQPAARACSSRPPARPRGARCRRLPSTSRTCRRAAELGAFHGATCCSAFGCWRRDRFREFSAQIGSASCSRADRSTGDPPRRAPGVHASALVSIDHIPMSGCSFSCTAGSIANSSSHTSRTTWMCSRADGSCATRRGAHQKDGERAISPARALGGERRASIAFDKALRSSKSARVSAASIVGFAADRACATAARRTAGGAHAGVDATCASSTQHVSMCVYRLPRVRRQNFDPAPTRQLPFRPPPAHAMVFGRKKSLSKGSTTAASVESFADFVRARARRDGIVLSAPVEKELAVAPRHATCGTATSPMSTRCSSRRRCVSTRESTSSTCETTGLETRARERCAT